jgi:dihydroflavonol-4-reductase
VVRQLIAHGAEVVAIVRSARSFALIERISREAVASGLPAIAIVRGDAADQDTVRKALDGVDTAFNVAGMYEIGIPASRRAAMFKANVECARVLLEEAEAHGPRIVHVSTAAVFGNTHGRVADEAWQRLEPKFLSYYDETKYVAHRLAQSLAAAGRPIVIVQPAAVYGPGDRSDLSRQIEEAREGRYRLRAFPSLGLSLTHVDDVALGTVRAATLGRVGESYILGGENTTLGCLLDAVATRCGHVPPRLTLPPRLLRAFAPLGPVLARPFRVRPNMREIVTAADGVTYWTSSRKANQELGYASRSFSAGLNALTNGGGALRCE